MYVCVCVTDVVLCVDRAIANVANDLEEKVAGKMMI